MFKSFKLAFPIGVSILFIVLGYNLIQRDEKFDVIAGYANLIVFSIVLLLCLFKLFQLLTGKKN